MICGDGLSNKMFLAPLAGFSDAAFRRVAAQCGAALTVTEMVSVNGLFYGSEKTDALLIRSEEEKVCAVQLFGNDPERFYRVLKEREQLSGFDFIDVNMGCPMPKVTKQGAGSALLNDVIRAGEIVAAAADGANGRKVGVKMRLGINDASLAEGFAAAMEKAGAGFLTVHGRTVKQMYGGKADWDGIAAVKKAVSIPVYGNGDITCREQAAQAIERYGVDGVAVGRGAIGNPWLFGNPNSLSKTETVIRQIDYMAEYFSEKYALTAFRKHAAHYFKGTANAKKARVCAFEAENLTQLKRAVETGFKEV